MLIINRQRFDDNYATLFLYAFINVGISLEEIDKSNSFI